MGTTRVGIIGLGSATKNIHLPALRKLAGVEIVGGYDPSTAAKGGQGVPRFGSVDDLLSSGRPDILVIATPPSSHADLARRGLLAGCHIFCEKPLANSLAEADAIIAVANGVNRHVVVNSEFPFMAIHADAKKAMTPDKFGRLLFMEVRQSFVVTDATEEGWRGRDPQRSFKEFGTHVIDLAKFFFDERPSTVRARMPRPFTPDSPDYLNVVELSFSGDRIAHIVLNRLARGRHSYLDIALSGERSTIETSIGGRLQLSGGLRASTRRPFLELDVAMGGRARRYQGERFDALATSPLDLFAQGTARLFQAFLDAIAAGDPPPNSLEEARNTLALLYACYDSAEDGTPRDVA